jgi:hypothetical protein
MTPMTKPKITYDEAGNEQMRGRGQAPHPTKNTIYKVW